MWETHPGGVDTMTVEQVSLIAALTIARVLFNVITIDDVLFF